MRWQADVSSLNAQLNDLARDNVRCIGAAKEAEEKVAEANAQLGRATDDGVKVAVLRTRCAALQVDLANANTRMGEQV
ncbi:hypothetical protein FOA52_009090 [Chlamydomonas sp. UWO 241]|nr:hypothetical protein FOA52_009090 [Chlamydomonas sp. UWO 241]